MMYDKRVRIFVIASTCLLLLCLLRLAQIQLLPDSSIQDEIKRLKLRRGLYRQLKTVRGKILDRNGWGLAVDEPLFQLCINYRLSCFMDERVREAKRLRAMEKPDPIIASAEVEEQLKTKLEDLQRVIDKCVYLGVERSEIENRIKAINNKRWNLRRFLAWVRNGPDQNILKEYPNINDIPTSVAIADFEKKVPIKKQRLLLTAKVDDIPEMNKNFPLLELKTDDDIFTAQLEFLDVDGIEILSKTRRTYPYGSVAAQTIGWVGRGGKHNKQSFADEVSGQRPGVEYVCDSVLRGRHGEEIYDIDRELVNRTETQLGEDVSLTLDIKLQKRIENYLTDYEHEPNCGPGMSVVVIDVATGDILALVSMPTFALNRIRRDYADIASDSNEPLLNRAINKQYPPGSCVKPLILIAGLESGKITEDEIISCQAKEAPKGWPSCWLYNRYPWMCHDDKWQNNARNAIKGSCNIYFTRLADRIDPLVLQQWLFKFGYGHKSSLVARRSSLGSRVTGHESRNTGHESRDLRQAPGIISSANPEGIIVPEERRLFGIGQGNLRATPLQVANAFAAIARRGAYKPPRLFMNDANDPEYNPVSLNISEETLDVVRDGMAAVVNEPGGTAYKEFAPAGFAEQGVTVYGKTGSTQQPANAWFGGFAKDGSGQAIAIAIIVEGGQHGSSDAGPLARDIIQFCIEEGYLGQSHQTTE